MDIPTSDQYTQTALNQKTPQEIARIISEQVKPKQSDVRRNLESFRTRNPNTGTDQSTSTSTHSYQNNRPQNRPQNNNSKPSETHMSPPLPNYPPPVRPPPPEDYTTDSNRMQQRVQKRWFEKNSSHI